MKTLKIIYFIIIISAFSTTNAGEHVVFERIGMMSGATSFIHVHVTLGIELLRKQVDQFRDLLESGFGTAEKVEETFRIQSGTNTGPQLQHLKAMASLWHRVAEQHKLDVLDIYTILDSLRNTLPDLPNQSVKKIGRSAQRRDSKFSPRERIRLAELEREQGLNEDVLIITHREEISQPENHHFFFQSTTTTTTTTKTTTKPSNSNKATSPYSNPYMVDASALSPPMMLRKRREAIFQHRRRRMAGIIALPMAVAATAMGIYNLDQINFLKTELGKLQDNQDRLFEIISRHESMLQEISDGFKVVISTLLVYLSYHPSLFDARLTRIENQIRTHLSKTTHALQAGLVRKLAVDYLTPGEIRKLYAELVITADKLKCELLIHHHSDLFQLETSLLFDGEDAHLLIHVPMVPQKALLRLYKLHPIPLPLTDSYFLIPDVKNDVLAISASDSRYAVQLSSTDLMGCFRANQMFMCERFGVLNRGYNDTCLGALYNQQFVTAQNLCRFEIAPIAERVYQLEKHHFLIYLPAPLTIPIRCRNGTTTEKHLAKGHQEVFISPGCEAEFHQHKIMTDTSITFPADVIHFEWVWDQIKITNFMDPADLPADLVKLAETGISRPTLADLQFMAVTKQKIAEMVKPQDWGLSFIHTLGSGTLGVCLILVAVFVAYKCYQRRKNSDTEPNEEKSNINIFNCGPSAPPAAVVTEQPITHPLARDPRFRRSPKTPKKSTGPTVHFNKAADSVDFPYDPPHEQVVTERLRQRREDLVDELVGLDDRLHHSS